VFGCKTHMVHGYAMAKPWYRQFATMCAAKRVSSGASGNGRAEIEKLQRRVAQLESKKLPVVPGQGSEKETGPGKFIPAGQLAKWQMENKGKCFKFHLKGACSNKAGECPHGSH
jgi:hypothetical protein